MLATRYIVMRELGSGGSGVVHEVIDRRDGAVVALKVLRATSPEALYRFKREFRALRDLIHPNLIGLRDLAVEQGQWYFTMDLVPGEDFLGHVWGADRGRALADATTIELERDAARFDEARLRDALRQLVLGLVALHDAGKIHRDLKPSNVRVRPDGRVVVLDFGLVADANDPGRSSTNLIVGTPAYMAPEQVACDTIGPAADWYAVGVMLYEALTGRLPFTGSLFQVLEDRQTTAPPPPSKLAPGIPRDLDRLCSDLLQIDPAARPGGAEILVRLDASAPRRRRVSVAPPGRVLEAAELESAVRTARRGRAAAVCLVGPTGSGKSRLLRRALAAAARDPRTAVLSARCHARERVPFQGLDGVVDGLSRLLSQLSYADQLDVVQGSSGALAAAFPVLGRVPVLADLRVADGAAALPAIAAGLRDLLTRLAAYRAVVICIDDLDWADEDGRALLAALIDGPDAPPIAWLLAAGDDQLAELPRAARRVWMTPPCDDLDVTCEDLMHPRG